jgi:hypothetical protein
MTFNRTLAFLVAAAQCAHSTVIIVGVSKDGIVMAADKRDVSPNKPPNDIYVKIISLGKSAAFASLGNATRIRNTKTGRVEFDADAYTKKALQDKRISKEQLQQFGAQMGAAIRNLDSHHVVCGLPPVELIFAQVEDNAQVVYKLILDNCNPSTPEVYPLTHGDGGHVTYDDLMFGAVVEPMTQLKNKNGQFYERVKNSKDLSQFFESIHGPLIDPSGTNICHTYQLLIDNVGAISDSSSKASDCAVINKNTGFKWIGKPTSQSQGKAQH